MISTLIAIPYKVARAPLALIDSTLSDRLPETSLPRTALDRVIGTSDKLAGTVLRDHELAESGADRLERSATLRKAARFEHTADARRFQAQQTRAQGFEEAAQKRAAADDRAAEGFRTAADVEARGKQESRAEAKSAATERKNAADQKAANREATIEQRKQNVVSAEDAKKKRAQRKAKAKSDDARAADQSAKQSRADADRLEGLTEAKKQERKQD